MGFALLFPKIKSYQLIPITRQINFKVRLVHGNKIQLKLLEFYVFEILYLVKIICGINFEEIEMGVCDKLVNLLFTSIELTCLSSSLVT